MLTILIISQVLTWILLGVTVVALLAVARQVGVLHERVAPVGVLTPSQGPAVGSPAPRMMVTAIDGQSVDLGGALPKGGRRLMLFVSAQCPICKKLIPFVKSFARDEKLDVVFLGDDNDATQRAMIASAGIGAYPFVNDGAVGRQYGVDKLPHAVLLADDGRIISRGLVNSREHLESMIVADETGHASVQDFLRSRVTNENEAA